jgi:transcriptional regulator with XRE-family HTH domain
MATKKKLASSPTRISRKLTARQRRAHDRVARLVEQEVPPQPVSLTRQIVARLKNLRERQGITLQTMEERTGMKKANLSRFENKAADARLSTLEAYAGALGITLQVSLGDTAITGPPPGSSATAPADSTAAEPPASSSRDPKHSPRKTASKKARK